MKRKHFAAAIAAVTLVASAGSALAADLDHGRVPVDRYSAYEDPRYRDLYAPPHAYAPAPGPYYRGEPPPPVPPAHVYGPNRYHYSDARPSHGLRFRDGCLPHEAIQDQLFEQGWRDLRNIDLHDGVAKVQARRVNGDVYALKLDRCTGEVVSSRLLDRVHGHGPHAYENGGSRWQQRPYY